MPAHSVREAAGVNPQSLPVVTHFNLRNTCQTWQEGHLYREHACLGSEPGVEPRVPSEITFSPRAPKMCCLCIGAFVLPFPFLIVIQNG